MVQFKDFLAHIRPNGVQYGLNIFLTILIGGIISTCKITQSYMTGIDTNGNGILDADESGEFIVDSKLKSTQFLIYFGFSKAIGNLLVGIGSDRYGRKRVLIAGWLIGLIIPIMVMSSNNWTVIAISNLFLGFQQAFCWSCCIFMMVDYGGAKYKGVSVGLNETFGYASIAIFNKIADAIVDDVSKNYRIEPYIMILAFMIVGLLISIFAIKDTSDLAQIQRQDENLQYEPVEITWPSGKKTKTSVLRMAFVETTFLNTSLIVCCLAGFTINFLTAFEWGIFTKWIKTYGNEPKWSVFPGSDVSNVLLAYGLPKGLLQSVFGFISDKIGRTRLIVSGLVTCSIAILLFYVVGTSASSSEGALVGFIISAIILGTGTAMMYSSVIAAVGDHADSSYRASAIGTYRFWRDTGYGIGGLILGVLSDATNISTAAIITCIYTLLISIIFNIFYKDAILDDDSVNKIDDKVSVDDNDDNTDPINDNDDHKVNEENKKAIEL